MNKVKYGRLHVHSGYSLHDAACTPEEIVARAKEMGCQNITLTDHGTLLGILHFMKAGEKHGINTIPGIEFYLENREHFLVVARNHKGYVSLSHALKSANKNLHERKNKTSIPCLLPEDLEAHFKGNPHVFATTACIGGAIGQILLKNRKIKAAAEKMKAKAAKLKSSWELFERHDKIATRCEGELKLLAVEKKALTAHTKASYQKKIDKCESESEKELMQQLKDESVYRLGLIEDEKISLNAKKKESRAIASKNKARHHSYAAVLERIASIATYTDKELYEEAKEKLMYYKSIFPHFFVEVQYCGIDDERYVLPIIVKLARETNTPLIMGSDAHMVDNSEDSIKARQIMRYNYFKKHQEIEPYFKELYLKDDDQSKEWFSGIIPEDAIEEAMENLKVLTKCKVVFPKDPHYPKSPEREMFLSQLEKRKNEMISDGVWNEEYESRFAHEVHIITSMGFIDYHMIVQDFCNAARLMGMIPKSAHSNMPVSFDKLKPWMKKKGFAEGVGVGPGRGSAAGSLVCYMLGITNIDPILYGLLFERFLNPERVSMPDIDSDIKTSIRPYLINYLKWKYGEDATCAIATEMTYAAKNAVKLAARDLGSMHSEKEQDKAQAEKVKYIYKDAGDAITKFMDATTSLEDFEDEFNLKFQNSKTSQEVWKNARLIEGRLSGTSVHAGAIIISDNNNVSDYIPVHYSTEKEIWAAQCNMVQAEEDAGLLKMDVLGLTTLDCISDTITLVKKHRGISLDPDKFPFDPDVFSEIFATGRTNSVFQFESGGMKEMLRQFKPTSIQDIILLVAAYRPGPMQYLEGIINVKHGREKLQYLIPELEPFLSMTYGAVVYQEQVMQIFQSLAGYSLGQADIVRRAMSKKKMDVLEKERKAFIYGDSERSIYGTSSKGIDPEKASELFDQILEFSKYAFNKSHAACYAIVAYQTAYLKHHYTKEYMCAMFQNKPLEKFGPLFEDMSIYNLKLLPPSIHNSYTDFVIEKDGIRFGFSKIKGIGDEDVLNFIVKERSGANKERPFESFADFLSRTSEYDEASEKVKILPKKIVENFIFAGVFDDLNPNRQQLLAFYDQAQNLVKKKGDHDYFYTMLDSIDVSLTERNESLSIAQELKVLDQLISVNPLHFISNEHKYGCTSLSELGGEDMFSVSLAGFPLSIEEKNTKKGKQMLMVDFKTIGGIKRLFAFGNSVAWIKKSIQLYKPVKVKGTWRAGATEDDDGLFIIDGTNRLDPFKSATYIINTKAQFMATKSILNQRVRENEFNSVIFGIGVTETGEKRSSPYFVELLVNDDAFRRLEKSLL